MTAAFAQADSFEQIARWWEEGVSAFAHSLREAQVVTWSGTAADTARAAVTAYLAEARELTAAFVELSEVVRAAAEAIVTTRSAIPEPVGTEVADAAAKYGAQEWAVETARTAMHERYVLPFGTVDRRIPVLPRPTRRVTAFPEARWASEPEEGRSSASLDGSPKDRPRAEDRPDDRDGGDDRRGGGRGGLDRPGDSGDDDRPGDSSDDDRPQPAGSGPRDDRAGEERASADADSQGLSTGQESHEDSDSTDLAATGTGASTVADNSSGATTMADNGTGPTTMAENSSGPTTMEDNDADPTTMADNGTGATAIASNGTGPSEIEGSGTAATSEGGGPVGGGPDVTGARGGESAGQGVGESVVRTASGNAGVAPLSPPVSGFGTGGGTTPLPAPDVEPDSGWVGERPGRQDLSRDVRQDLAAGGTSATGSGERAWAGGPRYQPSPLSDPLEPGIGRSVPGAAGPVIGANPSTAVSAPRILDRLFHYAAPTAGQVPDPQHERALPDYS
ncbi:hypothetical protein [Nocardia neocaledoniensis]|uniref:hypothetical protein n=1 Tax=Nocardia neocaledoniensis TaxID=236511 RepID=UPI0011B7845C|nr:hypothetical protein [Nocardia neocaledoniensis]